VGVGNTIGKPVLNFAAFDLDGSFVRPPDNVSAFKEMRNHMLTSCLNRNNVRARG
jgi:hypothetical protein